MPKRAAIDIGSNTVQLLVAESDTLHFRPSLHLLRTTRLGALTVNGQLAQSRIAATLAVLQEYQATLRQLQVTEVRVIATSAVRDAANRAEFVAAVAESCGWTVEVLSGEEEARLSFWGALGNQAAGSGTQLLIDIGGGSTELIRRREGRIEAHSADIGAVRAQVHGWDAAAIAALTAQAFLPHVSDSGALAVGVGGTITTAAALLQQCREYSRQAIENYRISPAQVEQLLAALEPLSLQERCAYSPLLAERGEIIVEGLWILQALLHRLRLPSLLVSGGGVLDGCLRAWSAENG